MLSAVMEDYLKAIYHLQIGTDERVSTSEIAEYMDVSPPTVTSMIGKLAERELVDREKYAGVELTTDGERVALEVIRHHRLLEAYLTEQLDYNWSDVHDEADRLEHHISEEFERRLAESLGDPDVDPHGAPIPSEDLEPPNERTGTALADHDETETVVVEQVSDDDPEVLDYLAEHGITPGVELTIVEIAPFGMVTVRPSNAEDDDHVSLPETIAHEVRVRSAVTNVS